MWLKMWGVSVQREAVQRLLHPLADDIGPQNSTKTSSHLTNIYQMLLPVRQVLGSTMDKINRCPPQGAPHPMLQVARGEEPQSQVLIRTESTSQGGPPGEWHGSGRLPQRMPWTQGPTVAGRGVPGREGGRWEAPGEEAYKSTTKVIIPEPHRKTKLLF